MLKMITDDIPAGLETYYQPVEGGKFRLQVEDAVPVVEVESLKQKNKEFRETNINLMKENEKYKGFSTLVGSDTLTPDKFQEKIETLAQARVATITQEMKSSYETRLKELSDVATRSTGQLSELVLGSEVTKAASEHGVLGSALEDVLFRARNNFEVKEGAIKFKEDKLNAEGQPYTLSNWMKETRTKAPHLFAPSQGTGATKPNGSGARTSGDSISGVDRIAAALANRNNSSVKRLS